MSAPLSELLTDACEKLVILGRKHAVSHFEKGNFLDSPNEEVQKWLDRNLVISTQAEFDQLYDAYCKGFQSYHVEKWISNLDVEEAADLRQRLSESTEHVPHKKNPSPTSRLFKPVADPCPACGLVGAHFCTGGQPPHPGWSASASSLPVSSPSPASSVVPSPLVTEVVKAAQEALELAKSFVGEYSGKKSDRAFAKIVAALTALRNYSPAPSPSVPKEVLSPEELKRRNYHEIYG